MNTPSPLVPQGTTPPRPKSSIYFKVLMILTVHVVVIGGMLLQGCKDTTPKSDTSQNSSSSASDTTAANSNSAASGPDASMQQQLPTAASVSNAAVNPTPAPINPNPAPIATTPTPTQNPGTLPQTAPIATGDNKEYVVVKGDTLAAIAHRNGVSLKALLEANAGVNPKKLHVGQKVEIPAAGTVAAAGATPGAASPAMDNTTPDTGALYTVKSGDMLLRIAKNHGTTVRKIMALNELKSTSIRVGQKLKLPAPKSAGLDTGSSATSVMQPPASAGPVSVSASATPTPAPSVAN